MKKIKKINLLLLSSAFFIFSPIIAQAGSNHGDTHWANDYRIWSPEDHTPARKKLNRSAYYCYIKSSTVPNEKLWAALYDGRDASGGHKYVLKKGDSVKLWNNAVERKGSGVSVRINFFSRHNGKSSGVWSPDSI